MRNPPSLKAPIMKLSHKLALGFGSVIALLIITGAVALQALRAADAGFDFVGRG